MDKWNNLGWGLVVAVSIVGHVTDFWNGRELARLAELEAVGPAAGAVVDARNLDFRAAYAVGDGIGRFGNDEFARSGDAARRAKLRIVRQQVLNTVEDMQGDALCGGRIMFGNVRAQGEKIVNRFRRPVERHTPFGDRRSLESPRRQSTR